MSIDKLTSTRHSEQGRPNFSGKLRRMYYRLLSVIKPPIDLSEQYISALYGIIPGYLVRGNIYCFDAALRSLPTQDPILEIGSFCGLSTNVITYLMQKHGRSNRFFTCDPWDFEDVDTGDNPFVGKSKITRDSYRTYAKENYIRNIQMFSQDNLPYTIESYSDPYFEKWRGKETVSDVLGRSVQLGGPLSFCYIDGNHLYPSARKDFLNCDEFLVPGGMILFDDSADAWGWQGVWQVVQEALNSGRYEVMLRNPNYLLRKLR